MIPTKEIESDLVKIIKDNKLFYIVDIFAYYTKISRATFYNRGIDKLDTIKEAINKNRVFMSQLLKSRWAEKDAAPVLQIALFKTISSEDDLRRLSLTYQDHSSSDGTMTPKVIVQSEQDKNNIDDI